MFNAYKIMLCGLSFYVISLQADSQSVQNKPDVNDLRANEALRPLNNTTTRPEDVWMKRDTPANASKNYAERPEGFKELAPNDKASTPNKEGKSAEAMKDQALAVEHSQDVSSQKVNIENGANWSGKPISAQSAASQPSAALSIVPSNINSTSSTKKQTPQK